MAEVGFIRDEPECQRKSPRGAGFLGQRFWVRGWGILESPLEVAEQVEDDEEKDDGSEEASTPFPGSKSGDAATDKLIHVMSFRGMNV